MLGTVTADHDEDRAVETLLEFRCEALILLGADRSAADLQALATTTPVVLIGRRAAAPNLDVVRSADNQGLEQVVDHLVGLGHRRIAHIDGGAGAISVDRRRGYRTAMRRHGQGVETRIIPGDSEEDGWRAAEQLLAFSTLPTAATAFNDHAHSASSAGSPATESASPQDISVTSYDNAQIARYATVDLTTVSQEAATQSAWAVRAAIERLDGGRKEPRESVLNLNHD